MDFIGIKPCRHNRLDMDKFSFLRNNKRLFGKPNIYIKNYMQ